MPASPCGFACRRVPTSRVNSSRSTVSPARAAFRPATSAPIRDRAGRVSPRPSPRHGTVEGNAKVSNPATSRARIVRFRAGPPVSAACPMTPPRSALCRLLLHCQRRRGANDRFGIARCIKATAAGADERARRGIWCQDYLGILHQKEVKRGKLSAIWRELPPQLAVLCRGQAGLSGVGIW